MSEPCQRAPDLDVPFLNGETDALLYVRFGFAAFVARNLGRPGRKACGEALSETGRKMFFFARKFVTLPIGRAARRRNMNGYS